MNADDVENLRKGVVAIDPAASHRATQPPAPSEIYTPSHHVAALDPDNSLVVGIRGVGKSFWAGALGDQSARAVAVAAYPKLELGKYDVAYGFTGFEGGDPPSPETVQQYASDLDGAKLFWRMVVLRSFARQAKIQMPTSYREMLASFSDSERREAAMREAEAVFQNAQRRFLLVFDALDTLSSDWKKLRLLTKALLEVTYAMRSYRSLRLKLFLRPEQLDDPAVGFTDLSKLKAGKIDLSWDNVDLYGLFFTRVANEAVSKAAFIRIAKQQQIVLSGRGAISLPAQLTRNPSMQEKVFNQLAGRYMGADHRKGKTFTWLPAHLADGFGVVTPRSFLKLLREAAAKSEDAEDRVLTIEGIKEGLRAASRMRVDQIKEEYQWIELALAPLSGLRVPCSESEIVDRWKVWKAADSIESDATEKGYLAPSEMPLSIKSSGPIPSQLREKGLLDTLLKIGVLQQRVDQRINMPDIFRIGAALIGRGRVAPEAA